MNVLALAETTYLFAELNHRLARHLQPSPDMYSYVLVFHNMEIGGKRSMLISGTGTTECTRYRMILLGLAQQTLMCEFQRSLHPLILGSLHMLFGAGCTLNLDLMRTRSHTRQRLMARVLQTPTQSLPTPSEDDRRREGSQSSRIEPRIQSSSLSF